MGVTLFALRRWALPLGAVTLLLTLNVALVTTTHAQERLIPAALGAGLLADALLRGAGTTTQRIAALRLFAFVVPAALYLLYFLILQLTGGITWSIHLWLGASVLGGIVGFLLSYAFVPPAHAYASRTLSTS